MPSVNDQDHQRLLDDVEKYVRPKGYITASLEYHTHEAAKMLSNIESPGSHVIRTRADRFAIRDDSFFRFDGKTSKWPAGAQFAIEAIPYLSACLESYWFQVHHVFCCRRKDGSQDFGILAHKGALSYFDKILVPDWRRNQHWINWFSDMKNKLDLQCAVIPSEPRGGSGDAFVTLNVDNFPHWTTVIDLVETI